MPVENAKGLGTAADQFNSTRFTEIRTDRLRLQVDLEAEKPAGVMEWRVYNVGPVPVLPPVIHAGIDRSVMIGGQTYLSGKAIWLEDRPENVAQWFKVSGPGTVTFAKATSPVMTAKFSAPGDYVLALMGSGGGSKPNATVHVHAEAPPPADRLDVVYTRNYTIDSPLWGAGAKTLLVDWIPHCIDYCERTDIPTNKGDGGLDNFIEAAKAIG